MKRLIVVMVVMATGANALYAADFVSPKRDSVLPKADDGVAGQLRIPLHVQYAPGGEWLGLGAAGWMVFPDTFAPHNETATLTLGGFLYEYGKGNWIELLGGTRNNEDGFIDPLVNLRFFEKTIPHLVLGGDVEYFPRQERERLYSIFTAETPVKLGKYTVRIGLEAENIFWFVPGKKDSLGIGPRVTFPLPLGKSLSASFALGYEFRNDRDFVRGYLGFTYRLGKKK